MRELRFLFQVTAAREKGRKLCRAADSVLQYYKRMIQICKQELGLIYGAFVRVEPKHPQVFAYERRSSGSGGVWDGAAKVQMRPYEAWILKK